MGFQLPKLTTDIDCGPIGYPGLIVRFWLNFPMEDYREPENPKPWEVEEIHAAGRYIECIIFPPDMTDDGEEYILAIPDGKALHELWELEGFDTLILHWSLGQFATQRVERMQAEVKN